jgi:hypothetical protein
MSTTDLAKTLATLYAELVNGAPASPAYVLSTGDVGLLRSLDALRLGRAERHLPQRSVPT